MGSEDILGGNENPPVISDGSGSFRARFEDDEIAFRLRYDVASQPSDVTQAHLHIANPGNKRRHRGVVLRQSAD